MYCPHSRALAEVSVCNIFDIFQCLLYIVRLKATPSISQILFTLFTTRSVLLLRRGVSFGTKSTKIFYSLFSKAASQWYLQGLTFVQFPGKNIRFAILCFHFIFHFGTIATLMSDVLPRVVSLYTWARFTFIFKEFQCSLSITLY